jgi:hypothetical protein
MKLGRLLEFHHQHSPDSGLPKNLGDSFLVQKNNIYRKIRAAAGQAGFQFSTESNPEYLALPLSQLEHVLETRKIPYVDNVSVLETVERKTKGSTLWDDVTDNLKRNNLFHESCHAVARSISMKDDSGSPSPASFSTADDFNTTVLRLLIEESFSNSCELLGIADVDDSAHRIFYEINSYIYVYNHRSQLQKAVAECGHPSVIKFLVGSYLFSNFLRDKIVESDFERMLKVLSLTQLPTPSLRTLRSVSKIAFELNPRFRWVTTAFYLRLTGFPISTDEIAQFDFLTLLEKDSRFAKLIEDLSKVTA